MTVGHAVPADDRRTKPNNFDAIRLAAAIAVIWAHAQVLARRPLSDPDEGAAADAGALAVLAFFSISGYLITSSLSRAGSAGEFLSRRVRRIYPGFVVALAATAFIVAPLSRVGAPSYPFARAAAKWLLDAVFLEKWSDAHAFAGNPLPIAVNGSLWTIKYEFGCYVLLLAIIGVGAARRRALLIATFVAYALHAVYCASRANTPTIHVGIWFLSVRDGLSFVSTFLVGASAWALQDRLRFSRGIALLAVSGVGLARHVTGFPLEALLLPIAVPYVTLASAFACCRATENFASRVGGDYSYGVYLYAFPIQQLMTMHFGGAMSPLLNFAIATPLALFCGILSWHLVEKRCIRRDRSEAIATVVPVR